MLAPLDVARSVIFITCLKMMDIVISHIVQSTLWRVLKAAMVKCGTPVVTYVMNPKSMPRERLLGRMDMDTREWSDGVLTDAARKAVKESPDVRCWIICDGDVDPEVLSALLLLATIAIIFTEWFVHSGSNLSIQC